MSKLTPNLEVAQQFLEMFEGRITFQTFDDKGKNNNLARILHSDEDGDWSKLEDRLIKANNLGCGIFFSVNETDGKGRTGKNIIKVRSLFVDLDEDGKEKLAKIMLDSFEPHIVVQSSPGKYQVYWLFDSCPSGDFTNYQKKMILKYGGDRAVHDLPRVLRVPGFYHQKNEPVIVGVVTSNQVAPYKLPDFDFSIPKGVNGVETLNGFLDWDNEFDREHFIEEGAVKGEGNTQMYKYACSLRARNVEAPEAMVLMQAANTKFEAPLTQQELDSRLKSAWRHEEGYDEEELEDESDEDIETDSEVVGDQGEEGKEKEVVKSGGKGTKSKKKKKKKKQKEVATVQEHIDLVLEHFGELRRDIFSDDLFYFDVTKKDWRQIANQEDAIKAIAAVRMESVDLQYAFHMFRCHLDYYRNSLKPRLIIDIPEWDKVDRITTLCEAVTLEADCPFFPEDFEQIVKEWMSKMFQRLYNPHIQNRVLVLKGGQGIGKDTWVGNLINGLERFAPELQGDLESKDTMITLSSTVALRIAEFDRTSRTNISSLKFIITTPFVYVRAPYARKAENLACRCSFVATANVDDLLRDYTGNRRYIVFPLDTIDWGYDTSKEYQMQLLAQGAALAKEKFEASKETNERMAKYIEQQTPEHPEDQVLQLWEHVIENELHQVVPDLERRNKVTNQGWMGYADAAPVIRKVADMGDFRFKQVQTYLRTLGVSKERKIGGKSVRVYEIGCDDLHQFSDDYAL